MNKILSSLFIVLFLLPICFAEYQDITNKFNLSVTGTEIKIEGDGLNYATSLSCNATSFKNEITQTWKKNVTCQTDQILWEHEVALSNMSNMIWDLKDQIHYYDLYANCNSNLTTLKTYKTNNEANQGKLALCEQKITIKERDIEDYKLRLKSYNTTKCEIEDERDNLKDQNNLLWFTTIAGVGTAVFLYVKKVRPQDKRKKNLNENGRGRLDI